VADASIAVVDGGGTSRPVDAQLVGTDYQQTITIGDGTTAGRVAGVDTDNSLFVETNRGTIVNISVVTSVTTSVTIMAARTTRRGALIFNDSTSVLYLSYGTTATTTTAFSVKIAAGALYVLDVPIWLGAVTGTWSAVNGQARITDISA
jgi:hypothetical protein